MMPVQGITDGYGTVVGQPARDPSTVDKMDFMALLVAQIKNQDPLSPMDNAEFTSQITQFTMLDEMKSMNASLDENLLVGQTINNTAMLGLVGRSVTVEGNKVWLTGGEVSESVLAASESGTVLVEVTDETGHVVAAYQRSVDRGLNDITWDGKLENGESAPEGNYSISVTPAADSEDVVFTTLMTGPVEGLRYENNTAVVILGGVEYYVSEIYKVS
jgi:flagellar basal-body rod modification protein FlgD